MDETSRRELAEEARQLVVEAADAVDRAVRALGDIRPMNSKAETAQELVEDCRGRLDRARDFSVDQLAAEPDD